MKNLHFYDTHMCLSLFFKKMKKLLIIVTLVTFSINTLDAQQQPSFTQFMYNRAAINPASFGADEALSITAISRWQWAGIEGAPQSQSLTIDSPIPGKNFALGALLIRDEISVSSNNQIMLGGSYRIPVKSGHLSFGLQGGLQVFNANYTEIDVSADSQNTFNENISNTSPNFGFGLAYSTQRVHISVSAPVLISSEIKSNGDLQYTQLPYYVGMLGLTFDLTSEVKFQPNLLVNVTEGAPVSIDYNANFLFNDMIGAGVSFRNQESISLLFNATLLEKFTLGYSYDLIINETLQSASTGSHELRVNYRLKWLSQGNSN